MNLILGNGDEWWKLAKRFEGALDRVSQDLKLEYDRTLGLGSPVIISHESGDHVRVPVILRSGPREFPVCYVEITDGAVDSRRLKLIADRALALARAAMSATPHEAYTRAEATSFTYP